MCLLFLSRNIEERNGPGQGQGHVLFGEFCCWCARRHVGHLPPDEEQRVMVSQAAI